MKLWISQFFPIAAFMSFAGWTSSTCFGQSSWLNDFASALPRVNFPATASNFSQPTSGFPSTGGLSPSGANPGTNWMGGFSPSLIPSRNDWKLGVFVQNTEVGAMVTQVAPGNAAQQAGIQQNDIIVTVGAVRIGQVDNRIVELADELRRSTDSMGRVSLLIFDARQGRLRSIVASMNSTSRNIAGSVALQDRMQLPFGSILTVQLQNVSQPYYDISGGKSMTRADGTGPFGFEINYDPNFVNPRDRYQLMASISSGNQVIYSLRQPIAIDVNTTGQPNNLFVERVSGIPAYGGAGQPGFTGQPGNVVNVGYPGTVGPNDLSQLFLQILGRNPSNAEAFAWQSYLQQGNTLTELKIKLLASSQFRDRFVGNESGYMQQMIASLTNRSPNSQELAFWMERLRSTRSPETVIREIMLQNP